MAEASWKDPPPVFWAVAPADPEAARRLGETVGVSPAAAQILLNRGLADPEAARAFLTPRLTDLPAPEATPGVTAAAERIAAAIRTRERILVCGDYDVDGISGTALLVDFFRRLGGRVEPYIPNRLDEGYGLSEGAVRKFAAEGTDLLVTVDHGTSAIREIALAGELGMEVVVIDHHPPSGPPPAARAFVNPWAGGSPGPHPCGVGTAFKVAWATAVAMAGGPRLPEVHREHLLQALALVALGTVADVMPLRGENRLLAHFGLRLLAKSPRPGLRALRAVAKCDGPAVSVVDVAFKLAPRLNAAGRLGRADLALELFLTDSETRADEIAAMLDAENRRRKEIETAILERACRRIEEDYRPGHDGAIVLGDPSWHAGVVGIVAARLVDRYHLPAAVVAFEGDLGRGSCRTVGGVALPAALSRCAAHLETFGGHDQAAGFTVRAERFERFRRAFDDAVREARAGAPVRRVLAVDVAAPLSAVSRPLVDELARFAPFGEGNPAPVFATRGLHVAGRPRRLGKSGDHLSFLVSDGRTAHRAVGFGMGDLADRVESAGRIDLAYVPRLDEWRADGSLELEIKNLAFGDSDGG